MSLLNVHADIYTANVTSMYTSLPLFSGGGDEVKRGLELSLHVGTNELAT